MARNNRKTEISQEAVESYKQVKGNFIMFIGWVILTIIPFYLYSSTNYVTATIQDFEKWEYEWVADAKTASYDRYIFYYYSCEFEDFDIQTGICVDKKWVPVGVNHKDKYIKYRKGDVITVYYNPKEYAKTGLVTVADREEDSSDYISLMVLFGGMTIFSIVLWILSIREYRKKCGS